MIIEQKTWHPRNGWNDVSKEVETSKANLVLVFGPTELIVQDSLNGTLKELYPKAEIISVSSVKSILSGEINDDLVCISAFQFSNTKIQALKINVNQVKDSFDAGAHLSAELDKDDLKYLMVFTDSTHNVNSSQLVTGIHFNISEHIPITGGVASDKNMSNTALGLNAEIGQGNIIAIGFSGNDSKIGTGMDLGWTSFGTERFISKVKNSTVYKIDHLTPLEMYTEYLEGLVDNVETSAQIEFPLGIKTTETDKRIIRSIVSFNSEDGSARFSGDLTEGDKIRILKTNISQLIDSAKNATRHSKSGINNEEPDIVFVVNCIQRSKILKDWTEDEISAVNNSIGDKRKVFGFYSSGELTPFHQSGKCELQNHTIVVTSIQETE
ncbi:FIST signal transduction protein [Reichenbachiella versicolor]|uniref:FIST signal transduction protein n=1 Tax=Reichenbachiella versicolor TaxID=1821036 RepID=UPI000D6EA743|nr:FIST N-terminal domain-containing protein [Reichenbachiella versicolor]